MTIPSLSSSSASNSASNSDRARFDITGPLPSGRIVLEASAGTGKTYSLTALIARFIAERATPVEQILVVTFTRAAANERNVLSAALPTRLEN